MLIPYKFDFLSCDGDVNDISNLILTAQDLATSYSSYQNRVDLNSIYRSLTGITCLDKVLYGFVQKIALFLVIRNIRAPFKNIRIYHDVG